MFTTRFRQFCKNYHIICALNLPRVIKVTLRNKFTFQDKKSLRKEFRNAIEDVNSRNSWCVLSI